MVFSYFAPGLCTKGAQLWRSTRGPWSRYFSGNQVCHTCGGSTTWSSTLMILGKSTTLTLASGITRWPAGAIDPFGLQVAPHPFDMSLMGHRSGPVLGYRVGSFNPSRHLTSISLPLEPRHA